MTSKLVCFIAIALAASTSHVYGADVRVTDSKGNTVEVRDVAIDYTVYNIMYSPDHERQGVRAYQGDGVATIKWERIEQIVIKPMKADASSRRLEADITLKNEKVLSLHLITSEKGLYGTRIWAISATVKPFASNGT